SEPTVSGFRISGYAGAPPASVFFASRRRHTSLQGDWSSDVCSSDLGLYSGFNPTTQVYDKSTWNYEAGGNVGPAAGAAATAGAEIGRASCRGRGWGSAGGGSGSIRSQRVASLAAHGSQPNAPPCSRC